MSGTERGALPRALSARELPAFSENQAESQRIAAHSYKSSSTWDTPRGVTLRNDGTLRFGKKFVLGCLGTMTAW